MRKKLGDVRNEISIIGRKNHDAEQTIARSVQTECVCPLNPLYVRLRVELEDWRSKNNQIQEELNQVKAQAEEMERKVEESKLENQQLRETRDVLTAEGQSLSAKLEELVALNQ